MAKDDKNNGTIKIFIALFVAIIVLGALTYTIVELTNGGITHAPGPMKHGQVNGKILY